MQCALVIFDIWSSILWSTDSCQNKVSADQYHMTISRAQVYSPSRSPIFLKLTADQVMVFSIWSRAHVFLNYINTKKWKGPLLGWAKKVLNIFLSVMDWFHYLISEKKFQRRVKCSLPLPNLHFLSANFFMYVTWKAKTDTNALPFNGKNRLLSV